MGIKFANQATGTLAAGITAAATSLTLNTGQGAKFPAVTAGSGDYFLLTLVSNSTGAFEIVMCVARAGDVLTIFRGLEGTVAAAFATGDVVDNRMTAGTMLDLSGANESFRNVIRNPILRIAQRGTSGFANNAYTLDGWIVGSNQSPAVIAASQQADTASFSLNGYSLRVTVSTAQAAPAAGDYSYIGQGIEGFLVRDMVGNPIAIRFEVRSAKTGLHSVSLRNATNTASYVMTYNITTANAWQTVYLSLPAGLNTSVGSAGWNFGTGNGFALWFMLSCGTTFATSTLNQWVAGNFIAATGQVNVLDTAGNIFAISAVQVEQNTVSSRLEIPEIAAELVRNMRYFYRGVPPVRGVITGTGATTGRAACPHPVPMRAVPTLTLNAGLPLYDGAATTTISAITTNFSTATVLEFDCNNAAALSPGRPAIVYQGSGGQLDVSAEL